MVELYKLTTQDNYTMNNCLWGENITNSGTGIGTLCSPGYIHAYVSPLLAVLLNPIHAGYKNPKLWLGTGDISKSDGLKVGCVSFTTKHEIELPKISLRQRVVFAILCAQATNFRRNSVWETWANRYLASDANADVYAAAAANAADTAANAAAYAATAADYYAANADVYAAADAAANAAAYADAYADAINFASIAEKAMMY